MKRVKQLFSVLVVGIIMILTTNSYAQSIQGTENKSVTSKGDKTLSNTMQTTSATVPVVTERNVSVTTSDHGSPMIKETAPSDNRQQAIKNGNVQVSVVENNSPSRGNQLNASAHAVGTDPDEQYHYLLAQIMELKKSEQDFTTQIKMNVLQQALQNMMNFSK